MSSLDTTPDYSSKKGQPYKKDLMRQITSISEEKLRGIIEGTKETFEDRTKQTIGTKASYDQIQTRKSV
jgi:hypothetical protein